MTWYCWPSGLFSDQERPEWGGGKPYQVDSAEEAAEAHNRFLRSGYAHCSSGAYHNIRTNDRPVDPWSDD